MQKVNSPIGYIYEKEDWNVFLNRIFHTIFINNIVDSNVSLFLDFLYTKQLDITFLLEDSNLKSGFYIIYQTMNGHSFFLNDMLEELIKKWLPYMQILTPLSLKQKIESDLREYLNI